MKTSKFTEAQIALMLEQGTAASPIRAIRRRTRLRPTAWPFRRG